MCVDADGTGARRSRGVLESNLPVGHVPGWRCLLLAGAVGWLLMWLALQWEIVVVAMSSVSCVVSVLELFRDVFAEDSVGCLEGSGFRGGPP